jgi:hypothetical protein
MTHFVDTTKIKPTTLCGYPWELIVENERAASCKTCSNIWAKRGWTFPLPATVL